MCSAHSGQLGLALGLGRFVPAARAFAHEARRPPVRLAEQRHQRRQHDRPDDASRRAGSPPPGRRRAASCRSCSAWRRSRTPPTITIAALVTTPAELVMPYATASRVGHPAQHRLADPADHEHVVVHRQSEQHHEQEQRQPGDDRAHRREAQHPLRPGALEHQDQQAVRGRRRRAGSAAIEVSATTTERNVNAITRNVRSSTNATTSGSFCQTCVGVVHAAGDEPADRVLGAGQAAERRGHQVVAQLVQRLARPRRLRLAYGVADRQHRRPGRRPTPRCPARPPRRREQRVAAGLAGQRRPAPP